MELLIAGVSASELWNLAFLIVLYGTLSLWRYRATTSTATGLSGLEVAA
jgi:hypothetical protein